MAKTITAEPRKIKKPVQRATRKGRAKADKARGRAKPQTRDKRKDVTAPLVVVKNGKTRKATKQQICVDLLSRPEGASIEELQGVTGWQAHSVRGFLAGAVKKKLGLAVVSEKPNDGPRRYRVLAVEA
jgi:hypothetical protein